jgi:uncharacterized protein (TIGR02147 family)
MNYSQRAFARDLDVSVSRVSELLNGNCGISLLTAQKMTTKLKLKPKESNFFLDIILSNTARNKQVRELARLRIEKIRSSKLLLELRVDQFKIISDWYHSAILEMTQLFDFNSNHHWIANKLGITAQQAKAAVDRLQNVGLIQIQKNGNWIVCPDAYETFSKSSIEVKKFHTQILKKSLHSIEMDPTSDREMQVMILALPKSELTNFSAKMRDFLQECWESVSELPKDELYSFSIQLTPIKPINESAHENRT